MEREKIIENMAHAMRIYDKTGGEKTWRELATAAYYAYINCVHGDALKAPDMKALR